MRKGWREGSCLGLDWIGLRREGGGVLLQMGYLVECFLFYEAWDGEVWVWGMWVDVWRCWLTVSVCFAYANIDGY